MPRSHAPALRDSRSCHKSLRRRVKQQKSRSLLLEPLETRQLLDGSWQNPFIQRDVTGDGVVVPLDVLVCINELNQRNFIDSEGNLPDRSLHPTAPFYDFSGDGKLVPLDVLGIINRLNNDTVPPTLVAGLTQDTAPGGQTNTDLLTKDARISGQLTDDTGALRLVAIVDDQPERTVTVAPNGTFQFDPGLKTDGSEDGAHQIRFIGTDGRNNTAAPVDVSFQLDTVGIAAPTDLELDSSSDTGANTADGITNDDTPTIHGDAVSGSLIQIHSGDQLVGQTTANSPWSITTAPLANGERTLTVSAFDPAGNASSAEITLTIDTEVPAAPTGLHLTAATDTGASQTDGITKNKTPTVVGSAEAGTTVSIFFGGEEAVGSVNGGAWQFIPSELADGIIQVTATAEDLAGNVSVESVVFRLTIDTQAPAAPTDLRLTTTSDTGQSSTDGITRETTPTYTATAETGVLVRLFINDEFTVSATANSPVLLTVPATLTEGQHTAFATAEDPAGNLSSPTGEIVTVIDTVAPTPATVDLSSTSDSGVADDQITSAGRVTLVGQAGAKSQVVLTGVGISALAGQSGQFQLTGVPLTVGDNVFNVETLDEAGNAALSQVTITRVDIAAAVDPVLRWNQAILDAIKRDASTPPQASRFMAMLHIAIFDAVSNIDGTPSYLIRLAPPAGASAEAAVSTAAHRVLSYAFPGQVSWFDAELTAALAGIPNGAAKTDGENFGRTIADAVIDLRSQDGWDDYVEYIPGTTPGTWQPTTPMYDVALLPHWAQLDPFAMESPSQFLPAGPPDLNSVEYATAVNELVQLGRNLGSARTAEQTAIARFWADGPGTITPPGHWNDIAQDVAADRRSSLAENARLFAMLNVALADAAISAWNTKFHYNFWRPIDAIQRADDDGNNQTTALEAWEPLLITPPFPDYTSGHSTFSGAAARILTNAFGDSVSFTTNSPGFPQADGVTPVQRSFTSFDQAANEAGRSRIFGGIHYEFANQDGLASGRSLADFVWDTFSSSTDSQAPRIILGQQSGVIASANLALTGRVLDNVSGVQSLEVSADGGSFSAVQVAADGSFTVTTNLATNGTADGSHRLQFRARDFRGNVATTPEFVWTLDTHLPTISITTTPEGGRLAGTVSGTGSPITSLNYRFGAGDRLSMSLPSANGAFATSADLSRLAPGTHTVHVTATDAAGLVHTASTQFNLASRIAFRVIDHTPDSGMENIGSTYRPQVFFSRPVDTDTLTGANFFATDSTGKKVPATIVPAQDGSFAWLFFTDPLPGASTITVHVDGNTIAAEEDGAGLDADSDGVSGGELTYSFSTVRLSALPGTSLSGKVVDPGVDLKPMTFDDIRPGPDGVLHTPDDRFLLPIAGVKVFILGLEDEFVVTDANGNFSFDSVPSGNLKLAVDGRTATNAPAGIYFPEMVMDMNIRVGEANTVMGTMGTLEESLANINRPEVYLPRLQSSILQTVSDTQNTLITVDGPAAPNLTDEQRQFLTLEVQPQSLIGPDGQPLANGQVGISTVPPELVREMLPPGLLQHTFDITIQAPEAATFSAPLTLTLPNVFNSPPGTKLNFLSFDHTTGRLVIEGTGTVSEDGLSVVTDAGTGITKPGWHGFTPPVTCATSGGPPPTPPPLSPNETVQENQPIPKFLHDDQSHPGFIEVEFKAPKKKNEPPPQQNNCPPRDKPSNEDDPPTEVTIEVQGSLNSFMNNTGDRPLTTNSFSLPAGAPSQKLKMDTKSLHDIFGANGFEQLTRDQLFGATIRITVVDGPATARKRTIDTYVVSKWVDVIDATQAKDRKGTTAVFMRTFADGSFNRTKSISTSLPTSNPTKFVGAGGKPFEYSPPPKGVGLVTWSFKPAESDAGPNPVTDDVKIVITVPFQGGTKDVEVGMLQVKGTATKKTTLSVDQTGYKAELKRVIYSLKEDGDGKVYYTHSDGEKRFVSDKFTADGAFGGFLPSKREPGPDTVAGTDDDTFTDADLTAKLNTEAANLLAAVTADYEKLSTGIVIQGENVGADVKMNWVELGSRLFGAASYDSDEDFERPLICTPDKCAIKISPAAQQWALAEGLNKRVEHAPVAARRTNKFAVGINVDWKSTATFAQFVANTVSHELGHTFGLNDAYSQVGNGGTAKCGVDPATGSNCNPNDIMRGGNNEDINLTFSPLNIDLLKAALGLLPNGATPLTNSLILYRNNINLASTSVDGIRIEFPDVAQVPDIGLFLNDVQLVSGDVSDLGDVAADGAGNSATSVNYNLVNVGYEPLVINSVSLTKGNTGFAVDSTGIIGLPIAVGESVTLTVRFDPTVIGFVTDQLVIESNANINPIMFQGLVGVGVLVTPNAVVRMGGDSEEALNGSTTATNNFGGVPVGTVAGGIAEFATIENAGTQPLIISSIAVEATRGFTLTGVPTNLAVQPITLARGETFTFGVSFRPDHVGIHHAPILISTNDPNNPVTTIGAVGTGLGEVVFPQWGDDFVAMEAPAGTNAAPLRVVSDAGGNFQLVIQPDQSYHVAIFDPITGLIAHGYGTTPAAGGSLDLTAELVFGASIEPDSDFDGLPDDVEATIGTAKHKSDTDGDVLADGVEIEQGWDPLDDRPIPLGIIANQSLRGEANKVVLEGSFTDAAGQIAYVATGSFGLAIVNTSKFYGPIALGQIDLPGNATDVSVDSRLQLAVVAANEGSVHIVDVSNPQSPQLVSTVAPQASQVEVLDGVAYVNNGTMLRSLDIVNRVLIQELDLGGGNITSIARERARLYAVDANNVLRGVDISGETMVLRDSITLPVAATKLFVANGVAYVGDAMTGGFATVDVSNANDFNLIAGPSSTAIVGRDIVATGSGQALSIGTLAGANKLQLLDVSTLSDTSKVTKTFDGLPEELRDVAAGGGFGYVAAGAAGLLTFNYLALDKNGNDPIVDIGTTLADQDLDRPGVQVLEGTTVSLVVSISDDVQVRNVELLVDGQVVRNDVSFPFDFSAVALTDAVDGQLRVQIRATDTGGNVGLSRELILEKVADTTAPTITSRSPNDGATRGQQSRTVQIRFSEPMDASSLTAGTVELRGPDGAVIAPIDIQLRNDDTFVQFTYPALDVGSHQIIVKAAAVRDRAGNVLGASDATTSFTVSEQSVSWINELGGNWSDPNNWGGGVVPGPFDHVVIEVPGNVTITHSEGETQVASLYSANRFTLSGGRLTVSETVKVDDAFLIDGGTLRNATVLAGVDGQGILFSANENNRLDGVTVNADMDLTRDEAAVRIANGLTLNGTANVWGSLARILVEGSQTITAGRFVLNTPLSFGAFYGGIGAATIGATLTLGPDVTVEGHGLLGVDQFFSVFTGKEVFQFFKLVNHGEIIARDHNEPLTVTAGEFQSDGSLKVRHSGRLIVSGLTGNVNEVEILHPDSQMFLRGNGYVINDGLTVNSGSSLVLGGEWTNAAGSTISVTNADVTLGTGEHPWSNDGTINLIESQTVIGGTTTQESLTDVQRQGGEVQFFGIVENAEQSLALDTFSSKWSSGRIRGGTIVASNSQPIQLPTGTNGNFWRLEDAVIDADIVVRSGVTLQFVGDWKNEETITVDGGTLLLGGEFSAADIGDIDVLNGGSVHVEGEWDNTNATIHIDDTMDGWSLAGGTVRGGTVTFGDVDEHRLVGSALGGTLDGVNVQGDLELNEESAKLTIAGGAKFQTAHLQANSAELLFAPNQTLTGTVLFEEAECPNFFCTEERFIHLLGPDASLTISPTGAIRTVAGFEGAAFISGEFSLSDGAIENQGNITLAPETSLTIGVGEMRNTGMISVGREASLSISGLTGNLNDLDVDPDANSIQLQGQNFVINKNFQATALTLDGTWTNNANITVANGFQLTLNTGDPSNPQRWHNPGSIQVTDMDVFIGGTYSKSDLDHITRTGGDPSLGGTLDNSNSTIAIDELLAEWSSPFFFAQQPLTILGGTVTDTNNNWVMSPTDRVRIDGAILQTDVNIPPGARLETLGEWTNTGTIDVKGFLVLGGEMTTAGLGTIKNTSGSVTLDGMLDNTGANLTLDNNTGVWLLGNATIHGGTLTVGDGSKLPIEGNATLDDVDVDGDLRIRDPQGFCCGPQALTLLNGTTFDRIHLDAFGAQLQIGENQTITGEVLLKGVGSQTVGTVNPDDTLTIGATGVIRTADGYDGFAQVGVTPLFTNVPIAKIVNFGTIESNLPGNALLVMPTEFENHGILRATNAGALTVSGLTGDVNTVAFGASGGNIQLFGDDYDINTAINVPEQSLFSLQGHWTNSVGITANKATLVLGDHDGEFGQINATDSIVRLTGDFTSADILGIQRTGGSVEVMGTLDNGGLTTVLNSLPADWKFFGGDILGGMVSTTANFDLPANWDLTLADVQFNGTVKVPTGTRLTLQGDWSNSGTIIVDGGDLFLAGSFDNSDLGNVQRNSGQVILQGMFDNRGGSLDLDNTTGSWRIEGGEILGGTVNLEDAQTLIGTSLGGKLTGVEVHGDLTLTENSASFLLSEGTTFETAHLAGNGSTLTFAPNETIVGDVLFEGAAAGGREVLGQGILTFDDTALLRTVVGFGGSVTIGDQDTWLMNHGVISSEVNNTTVLVNARTLQNFGRIESSNNATVQIGAENWENSGLLRTTNGTLALNGDYSAQSIGPGRLERTGGNVDLDGWLNNIDSTLALNAASGSWNIDGAEIYGGTYTSAGGNQLAFRNLGGVLNAVTANGPLNISGATVHVTNGLTLNNVAQVGGLGQNQSGRLAFDGTQTLGGTGEIVFGASEFNAVTLSIPNTTLTIGDAITVRGDTGQIGGDPSQFSTATNVSVINRGTITSEIGDITVGSQPDFQHPKGGTFLNLGTIRVRNDASLKILNMVGSVGNVSLPPSVPDGGNLSLDGTNYVIDHPLNVRPGSNLELFGSWTNMPGNTISVEDGELSLGSGDDSWRNLGTISAEDATVNLGGFFRTADLGTYQRTGAIVTNLRGTLNNANATFALNAATGSWNLMGGTILGGTVTQSAGASLILPSTASGTLDGVTLADDLTVQQDFELTIRNGLTFDTSTLTLASVDNVCCEAIVNFDGSQSVLGQGEIVLNTNNFGNAGELNLTGDDPGLTLGPQVVVRGAGFIGGDGPIIVQGTILANVADELLTIEGMPVTNEGTIRAENSALLEITGLANEANVEALANTMLDLDGQWSNTGVITVTDATVNLGGEFQTSGLGSFERTGGTVNLTGTLENTGGTLALDQTTGSWRLRGGTIHGGEYSAADGARLVFTDFAGTLDGLTANGDLDLSQVESAVAHIVNGLTLDNSSILIGNSVGSIFGGLFFDDTSTLGGTGSVVFGKHSSNFLNTFNSTFDDPAAGTLTIGPDITIRGSNGLMTDSFFAGRIVNNGKISADDSGGLSDFDYDRAFNGGFQTSTQEAIDTTGVVGAAQVAVYQTARTFGNFTYTIEGLTPNADFTLRLHFAEILDVAQGERLFNVSVNGTAELTDFDIVAEAGGKNKATVEEIAVTADADGKIAVEFGSGNNSPLVNALELKSAATVLHAIDAGQIAGGTITVNSLFANNGEVQARNGGVLVIRNLTGNANDLSLAGTGSQIELDGTDYVLNNGVTVGAEQTLNLLGTWRNTDTFEITGGTVNLGGEFSTSGLGAFARTGGTVNLTGMLDNIGTTLAFNASTGSWNLRGGSILGGDYTSSGGAQLIFTDQGGSLDGLTARGDLDLTQASNASAHVLHGLTLDNSMILIGNASGTTFGGLFFDDTSTLGGTGRVVFGKHSSNFLNTYNTDSDDPDAGTFTIGSNIGIHGSSGSLSDGLFTGQIVNQGMIHADDSGGASSFAYDRNFTSGVPTATGAAINTAGVVDAGPQVVYQTARTFGDFTYTFEGLTPSASHTLRLHFAEILDLELGARLFDVTVNGATLLDDFDIVAEAGGKNKAVVEEIVASSDVDGKIVVEFAGSVNSPLLSGLELKSGATVLQAIDAGQAAGGNITIFSRFNNVGTVEVHDAETLTIHDLNEPNSGTMQVRFGGQLNISGDFSQTSDGVTEIHILGTTPSLMGKLSITGTANLDGELHVVIVPGFVPAIDDTFVPITYGAVIGQFADIETTGLPAGTALSETYNPTDLTLTTVAALRGRVTSSANHPSHGVAALEDDAVASVFAAAMDAWCSWDATGAACDQLGNVQIVVTNLGGDYLGLAGGNRIWIDDDAAGMGWLFDETPEKNDSESNGDASPAGYDLFTVLAHELGHLLGAQHSHAHDSHGEVMDEFLDPSVRHSVSSEDLAAIFGEDINWNAAF